MYCDQNYQDSLQVITSCKSRFHIFDQARELYKNEILKKIVTDYPKFKTREFGIPDQYVDSMFINGILNRYIGKMANLLPKKAKITIDKAVHNIFDNHVSCILSKTNADFYIGLSSFSLNAMKAARSQGMTCILDHSSLHLKENLYHLKEESAQWNVNLSEDICADWIIEKENLEFTFCDYIIVPSNLVKESLVLNGVSEDKIIINPLGVSLDSFNVNNEKLGVSDEFRVIHAGSISLEKGVLTAIEGFSNAGIKKSKFILIGQQSTNAKFRSILRSMLRANNNIRTYKAVRQSELNSFYNQCDVFILMSASDGFGMVVPQAMACGLPVIVSENVGAKDIVKDGYNGFIIKRGDTKALAEKLKFLAYNRDILAEMKINAHRTAASGNSWTDYGVRLKKSLTAIQLSKK